MPCCRKRAFPNSSKTIAKTSRIPPTSNDRVTSNITVNGICDVVARDGLETVLVYVRGVLTISHDNVRYEFFSAMQSQRCSADWIDDLQKKWFKLTPYKRESLIKRVSLDNSTISVSELLHAMR